MPSQVVQLWIDSDNNKLLSGWNSISSSISLSFKKGDKVGLELHWVKINDLNSVDEIDFPISSGLKLAIGNIEAKATSGVFTLSYNGYKTPELSPTSTDADISSALNGLQSIIDDGGVDVLLIGNIIRITWNEDGVRPNNITLGSNELFPECSISINNARDGDFNQKQITQIHIKQSPIALIDSFVDTESPVVTCVQTHSPAFIGDNQIYRVSISPQPKTGFFLLRFQKGSTQYTTNGIGSYTDAISFQTALYDAVNVNNNLTTNPFSVTRIGVNSWDVIISSDEYFNLTALSSGLNKFKSKYGVLNLNTIGIEDLLSSQSSATAIIEIELKTDTTTQTLLQSTCTILNDLIDDSSYTLVQFEDVMPVNSVVRYDTTQSLNDSQKAQARSNIGAYGSSELVPYHEKDIQLEQRLIDAEAHFINGNIKGSLESAIGLTSTNPVVSNSTLTTALTTKANLVHTHAISDVTGIQSVLDGKSNLIHTQDIGTINNLQYTLDNKAPLVHKHAIGEIDTLIGTLSLFAPSSSPNISNATFSGTTAFSGVSTFYQGETVPAISFSGYLIASTNANLASNGDFWIGNAGTDIVKVPRFFYKSNSNLYSIPTINDVNIFTSLNYFNQTTTVNSSLYVNSTGTYDVTTPLNALSLTGTQKIVNSNGTNPVSSSALSIYNYGNNEFGTLAGTVTGNALNIYNNIGTNPALSTAVNVYSSGSNPAIYINGSQKIENTALNSSGSALSIYQSTTTPSVYVSDGTNSTNSASIYSNSISLKSGTSATTVSPSGITFPDGSTQSKTSIIAGSLTTNGYTKYGNGLILQWGVTSWPVSFGIGQSVFFPIQFPIACFNVTVSLQHASYTTTSGEVGSAFVTTVSNSSFVALTNLPSGSGRNVYWQAIGY